MNINNCLSQKGLCKSSCKPTVTFLVSRLPNVWRFDWVGVLEHASSAWEELANYSGSKLVRDTKLDSSLGAHPTSSDPQGGRAAMAAVLRREAQVRGQLCHLLLADFACFGYDIQACHARPRPPIGPSPRHPIRDVSSGSTEGFKVLEQAGARSAWRLVVEVEVEGNSKAAAWR